MRSCQGLPSRCPLLGRLHSGLMIHLQRLLSELALWSVALLQSWAAGCILSAWPAGGLGLGLRGEGWTWPRSIHCARSS